MTISVNCEVSREGIPYFDLMCQIQRPALFEVTYSSGLFSFVMRLLLLELRGLKFTP